jgi:hypothetical protein
MLLRELRDLDVYDVGPVTFPAYPDTSVDARGLVSSLWPQGIPEDVRSHLAADFLSRLELRDKKTKKVDGADLTADCFAFVGDEGDTSTWKLPIKFPGDEEKTKTHIRNALARFGQTKGIPADEKDKVWKKIVAAAKKYGIKVSEENSQRAKDAGVRQVESCGCSCDQCQAGNCEECSDDECADENCDHEERVATVSTEERERMKLRLDLALR